MLLYIFLVLGSWKGVMGKDAICDEPDFKVCGRANRNLSLPKTEADIDVICPKLVSGLDCLNDYKEKCAGRDVQADEVRRSVTDLVAEGCRKDSSLHLRIVQHIGCFHQVMEDDAEACKKYVGEKVKTLRKYIKKLEAELGYDESTYRHELWGSFQCLMPSFENLCFASKVSEKCGSAAGETTLEIIDRSKMLMGFCKYSSKENIAKLMKLLELELEEETSLNQLIRTG